MNKTTLKIILAAIGAFAVFPISAYAEGGSDPQKFAKHKEIKMQGIDSRVSILQQEKSCVQAAANPGALRACEQATHQAMEQLEEKQKASWESMKDGKK